MTHSTLRVYWELTNHAGEVVARAAATEKDEDFSFPEQQTIVKIVLCNYDTGQTLWEVEQQLPIMVMPNDSLTVRCPLSISAVFEDWDVADGVFGEVDDGQVESAKSNLVAISQWLARTRSD